MKKRASKSQLMIPFRTALDAGYAHLHKMEQLRDRINALGRPSFDNVKILHQLGIELLEDLTDSMQRSAKILELAKHWEQLAEESSEPVIPREIINHISIQLLLHHLYDSSINNAGSLRKHVAIDPARQRYETEIRDFIKLVDELRNRKVNVTRILAPTISNHRIHLAQHWDGWMEIYRLIQKKAIYYKRRYVSLKNESSSLLPAEVRSILVDECNCLCQLCDNAINAELLKKYDSIYRHRQPLISNSQIWNPLLKNLEELLSPYFKPKRNWERPGGFGQAATASQVYKVINLILHFCYPSIWPDKPSITAAIKSRCHRYSAS
jgi:hypothetical protein